MKHSSLRNMAAGLAIACASFSANAAYVDIVSAPTGYFVPSDDAKYDSPYWRWASEDWGYSHNAIAGTITSATLQISAFDVDYSWGERDEIFAFDNGVKTSLGFLIGADDDWAFTDFVLGANFFDDIAAGLQVFIDIDSTNAGWAVTLAKSALQINGTVVVNPDPDPVAVSEPATLALMGLGLVGLVGLRRQKRA